MIWAFKTFFRFLIRLPMLVFLPFYLIEYLLVDKPKRKQFR